MAGKELVLELGVEGGSATVYRTGNERTLFEAAGWKFHVEGSSIFIDENNEESWPNWTHEPVSTLQEALDMVAEDGGWLMFYPISVHPEYRAALWEIVQDYSGNLTPERQRGWMCQERNWRRLCSPLS